MTAQGVSTVKIITVLTVLFIVSLSFHPAYGSRFSPLILTSENIREFDTVVGAGKENSCVIVQVTPDEMDARKAGVLMDWVHRGGTLWFYDCRLAQHFGMTPAPFSAADFPAKTLEGEYGSQKKFPGIAVGCQAWGNHSITIGIRRVLVFILKVDENLYSAVRDEEQITPLLKVKREDRYSISAIKTVGRGHVIFKPLLWKDKYDGDDFQRKLMKYSEKEAVPFSGK